MLTPLSEISQVLCCGIARGQKIRNLSSIWCLCVYCCLGELAFLSSQSGAFLSSQSGELNDGEFLLKSLSRDLTNKLFRLNGLLINTCKENDISQTFDCVGFSLFSPFRPSLICIFVEFSPLSPLHMKV